MDVVAAGMARSPVVRIRLCFPEPQQTLSKQQQHQGLAKSWYLVHTDVLSIGHLVARIVHDFRLHQTCPHGITLEMSGFVLPPVQSTRILQDSDLVSVRRKQDDGGTAEHSREQITNSLSVDNEEDRYRLRRGGLLALEEFEKEAGGYQSEHSEDGAEDAEFSLGSGKIMKESSGKKRKRSHHASEAQILLEPSKKSSEKKKRKKMRDGDHGSSQLLALEGDAKTEKKKKKKKVREPVELELNSEELNKLEAKQSKGRKTKSVKETADLEGPLVKATGEEEELDAAIKSRLQKLTPEASRGEKKSRKRQDINPVDHVTEPVKKRRDVKESDDNESSPDEKKQPSRSARRKKAKKRWLREQKQNGVVPKQDDVKLLQKEELNSSESETSEEDVEVEEAAAAEEEIEAEEEILPVMVAFDSAPGHIRFDRDEDVREEEHPAPIVLSYPEVQCKKQGQAWGQEKSQFRYSKDGRELRSDRSSQVITNQSPNVMAVADLEKLPLLNRAPRVGDLLAYRLVELTASWTPELSNYRVGKVSKHDDTTKMILMTPVPEYPILVQEPVDVDEDGHPYEQPDEDEFLPPYNSDGTLEVPLSTLMEVRVLKAGPQTAAAQADIPDVPIEEPLQPVTLSSKVPQENSESAACLNLNTAVSSQVNHEAKGPSLTTQTGPVTEQPTEADWQDVLSEEINKKKLELARRASEGSKAQNGDKAKDGVSKSGENGRALPRTTGAPVIRHRYLRTGALGPTMALLRASQVL